MALTDLQSERIRFHLDFQRGMNDILAIDFNVNLSTLTATEELNIIGNLTTAAPADIFVRYGEDLATNDSILGRCEIAFDRMGPATVDPSQFVIKAGKVQLNPSEYKLRELFYKQQVKQLEKALGYAQGLFQSFGGSDSLQLSTYL